MNGNNHEAQVYKFKDCPYRNTLVDKNGQKKLSKERKGFRVSYLAQASVAYSVVNHLMHAVHTGGRLSGGVHSVFQSVFLLLVVHSFQRASLLLEVLQVLARHVFLHAECCLECAHGRDQRFHVVVDTLMQLVSGGAFG